MDQPEELKKIEFPLTVPEDCDLVLVVSGNVLVQLSEDKSVAMAISCLWNLRTSDVKVIGVPRRTAPAVINCLLVAAPLLENHRNLPTTLERPDSAPYVVHIFLPVTDDSKMLREGWGRRMRTKNYLIVWNLEAPGSEVFTKYLLPLFKETVEAPEQEDPPQEEQKKLIDP